MQGQNSTAWQYMQKEQILHEYPPCICLGENHSIQIWMNSKTYTTKGTVVYVLIYNRIYKHVCMYITNESPLVTLAEIISINIATGGMLQSPSLLGLPHLFKKIWCWKIRNNAEGLFQNPPPAVNPCSGQWSWYLSASSRQKWNASQKQITVTISLSER